MSSTEARNDRLTFAISQLRGIAMPTTGYEALAGQCMILEHVQHYAVNYMPGPCFALDELAASPQLWQPEAGFSSWGCTLSAGGLT